MKPFIHLKHFDLSEFHCNCGECSLLPPDGMDPFLLVLCDEIRERCGFALKVNSGYRCRKHNTRIGGAEQSQHMFGKAADLAPLATSEARLKTLREVIELLSPVGYGKYKTFCHVDNRAGDRKARWGR